MNPKFHEYIERLSKDQQEACKSISDAFDVISESDREQTEKMNQMIQNMNFAEMKIKSKHSWKEKKSWKLRGGKKGHVS